MEALFTPEQEKFIAGRIESGRFENVEEVVQAALALLEERESRYGAMPPREKVNLVQLFQESPLRGADIEFSRDKSPLRPIEL